MLVDLCGVMNLSLKPNRENSKPREKQNDKERQSLLNIQIYTMRSLEFQSSLAAAAAIK